MFKCPGLESGTSSTHPSAVSGEILADKNRRSRHPIIKDLFHRVACQLGLRPKGLRFTILADILAVFTSGKEMAEIAGRLRKTHQDLADSVEIFSKVAHGVLDTELEPSLEMGGVSCKMAMIGRQMVSTVSGLTYESIRHEKWDTEVENGDVGRVELPSSRLRRNRSPLLRGTEEES